jgi:hypothetical protein
MPKRGGERGLFGIGLGALSLGAVASAAAGGYKIAEFLVHAKKLHEVTTENKVFVRLIERVRLDLAEVDRLLKLPAIKHSLSRNPKKVAWIRNSVRAMNMALEQLGEFTATVEKDTRGGRHAGLRTRLKWVLDEHEKLVHRQMELNLSHQGIVGVIQFLGALEPMNCCEEEPITGFLPYGMQREDVYGGFASQARAMAQIEDEPRERVEIRERRDVYEQEGPVREKVEVRERSVYERDEPGREKVIVRKSVHERDEPEREKVFVRKHYERDQLGREKVQVRERSTHGRDEPRERIEIREKTKYGWDEPARERVEIRETRGPINMQDNDTVRRKLHSNHSSHEANLRSNPSTLSERPNLPTAELQAQETNYLI